MYMNEVIIKNFRNFENTVVNFNSGFHTIIGENNIGKSNLLHALRLVLDKDLSYRARKLGLKDFHGYIERINNIDEYILVSIGFKGENLDTLPNFHPLKTSENTMRVTYIYAHKKKFEELREQNEVLDETEEEAGTENIELEQDEAAPALDEVVEQLSIDDFVWKLFGGAGSNIEDFANRHPVNINDLEGINCFYIKDFRNIYRDIFGNDSSLLSKYCMSRENYDTELSQVKSILSESNDQLNDLEFIPAISDDIENKSEEIVGAYYKIPTSIGFDSQFSQEVWNDLKLYYKSTTNQLIPLDILGLGQKNIVYLTLFIATLENQRNANQINILLIEEPEAHLHPQLQKILFNGLGYIESTQVIMTSHSTHIASDCEFKNLCVLYNNTNNKIKAYSPFINEDLENRENKLLRRYLDATRSEMFFSSAVIFVEGVAEQFIIPAICKEIYDFNVSEYNVSIIPIHGRHFPAFLKLFQNNKIEIPIAVIMDGDAEERTEGEEETTAVQNAKSLEVQDRLTVYSGDKTLEIDLFPRGQNSSYLEQVFINLGHERSYNNLLSSNQENWDKELIKRVDKVVSKGRFAQELSLLIDEDFEVPQYIHDAITFIMQSRGLGQDV